MKTYGEWRYSSIILNLSTRWRPVVSFMHPAALPPIPIIQEAEWAPELVWMLWNREKSLAHSPSLYRLGYPSYWYSQSNSKSTKYGRTRKIGKHIYVYI
jgi:hypothetical protein